MANNAAYRMRRTYEVYGNTVRKPAPDRKREERIEREYREALLRKVRETEVREVKAQREYALFEIAVFAVAFLAAAVLLSVFMIQLSGNHRLRTELENNKKAYQALVRDNSLLEDKIDRETDYTAVYNYATSVLGMQAPESQQIVYYERSFTENVECRGTIPDE
ncbi:MAG: hypothetical protein IJL78_08965 [Lachnospiraceae bacterium]|nr:hypothetical protein [Lachnospiraceae bacterium]